MIRLLRKTKRDEVEYSPEYGAFLPRAPAFRQYSGAKIQEIVDRLARSKCKTDETIERREREIFSRRRNDVVMTSSQSARNVGFKLTNKATVASSIRRRLCERNTKTYPDVTLTCSRFERSLSRASFVST